MIRLKWNWIRCISDSIPRTLLFSILFIIIRILSGGECKAGFPEYDFSVLFSDRLFYDRNAIDQNRLKTLDELIRPRDIEPIFSLDETYNVLSLQPSLSLYHADNPLNATLTMNIDWLRTVDASHDSYDVDVYEAYGQYLSKHYRIQLGIQNIKFGNGLIFDGFELGAKAEENWKRVTVAVKTALIDKSSPICEFLLGVRGSDFNKIEFFVTGFSDQADLIGESIESEIILEDALSRALNDALSREENIKILIKDINDYYVDVDNAGELVWYGISAEGLIGDLFLSGNVIFQTGDLDFYLEHSKNQVIYIEHKHPNVSSWMGNIEFEYNFTDEISGGLFLYLSKGQNGVEKDSIETFLPISRYIPYALIFFGNAYWPSLLEDIYFQNDPLNGVIAPGFQLDFRPNSELSVAMNSTILLPEEKSDKNWDYYGCECDILIDYELNSDVSIFFSGAYFKRGDWFPKAPADILSVSLGVDFFYNFSF